jgi:hypothetical protein
VDSLLVDVDGCSQRAADQPERQCNTLCPSDGNPESGSNRSEAQQERGRVPPGAIRARHGVQARREISDEVILEQECRDKPSRG